MKYEKYRKSRSDVINVASIIGDTSSSGGSVLSNQSSNVGAFTVVLKENEDINKAAGIITDKLKKMDSLSNVTNNISEKRQEISINVDANKAAHKDF
jgi:multidrug efflux pump subunit AcrB